jgi:hypothetical protein
MATTNIDICARALILIGAQPISSFSDGSTEALVASNIYDDILEAALTRHRWNFATTQKQLSLLASQPAGKFDYAYQMPTDPAVLQIVTITVNDYVIPYDRYRNYIYVDNYGSNSNLIMDYIYKVDEQYFPPYFKLALEYNLASLFAGSVARDASLISQFAELAERQYLRAKHIDATEATNKKLDTGRYINLRQSTRSSQ